MFLHTDEGRGAGLLRYEAIARPSKIRTS